MKKFFLFLLATAVLCLAHPGVQAQTCTIDVVYNANLTSEADFQNSSALLTSCIQNYLFSNNGLSSTVSFVSNPIDGFAFLGEPVGLLQRVGYDFRNSPKHCKFAELITRIRCPLVRETY